MKKNNKRLTIIVASLLVVIGISFAYFMASLLVEGEGVSTKVTTARISGVTLHVEGTIDLEDTNMLPGHKAVSAVKVTATGNNQLIAYNLIWTGTNGISQINYKVYKSSNPLTPKPTTSCTPTTKVEGGVQQLSETCTISNFDSIGEAIASGSINKGDTKEVLVDGEFITATSDGDTKYYYIVLEYPNLPIDQSGDAGASISGEVTVEESDKEADINILAVYLGDEHGENYEETLDIPKKGEGYEFIRAECSNEATAMWDKDNWGLLTTNLTKSGTSCNLYFDKSMTIQDQIAKANPSSTTFTSIADTDEGVFSIVDPIYGGTSYYWRGAVTDNYVVFANKCWRIIRINGNGSIRIIFDSNTTTCKANGLGENATSSQSYNPQLLDNADVGYMKGLNSSGNTTSYSLAHRNDYDSDIKKYLDGWYDSNLADYASYIDKEAGFCNDRSLGSGYSSSTAGFGTKHTLYAAVDRMGDKVSPETPTLECKNATRDLFTPTTSSKGNKILGTGTSRPIGLITADEVVFAGGYAFIENNKFYLYNGTNYWTITPYHYNMNTNTRAAVFAMYNDGQLTTPGMSNTCGVRPVINLRPGTVFKTGTDDSQNNPYIVV